MVVTVAGSVPVATSTSTSVVRGEMLRFPGVDGVVDLGNRAVGRTDHLTISVSGSGNLELTELTAREASVDVTGSADLVLHVSEALMVNITGSADVLYEGGPRVNATITGSGSVSVKPR